MLKANLSLILASLLSIAYGAVIEILQGVLSIHRTTDIFDLVANCLGVFAMSLIIKVKKEVIIKKI